VDWRDLLELLGGRAARICAAWFSSCRLPFPSERGAWIPYKTRIVNVGAPSLFYHAANACYVGDLVG
jgi:hypothetical protein